MSLNDLAVDLTCEPQEVDLDHGTQTGPPPFTGGDLHRDDHSFINIEDILESIPGSYPRFLDNTISKPSPSTSHFHSVATAIKYMGGFTGWRPRWEVSVGLSGLRSTMH